MRGPPPGYNPQPKFVRIDEQFNKQVLLPHKFQKGILDTFIENRLCTNVYSGVKTVMAYLVCRGKIIASATNKFGDRSSGCGYSDRTIHAEKNVVKSAGNLARLRGCDMYIIRAGRGWADREFFDSHPCPECIRFLEKCQREYGLKKVYYTIS